MILTRTKCRHEHPLVLSAALNVAFIVIGGLATLALGDEPESFLSGKWAPMGQAEIVAILLLTVAILVGSIGAAVAYQSGPSSVIATFDFAYVGFAALWGLLLFDERINGSAWIGMILIVGAGIMAVRK